MKQSWDGLPVLRTPLYPNHSRSAVGRMANYLSYAASATMFGSSVLRRADVALVYSSPATAALPAMAARLRWGTPYVLMIMDLWPDSVFGSGFLSDGAARRIAQTALVRFTNQTYRWADHITVSSPGMRDVLQQRGVPESKLSVVYNWADEKLMQPCAPSYELRSRLGLTDEFVVMYAGNLGSAQRLDIAVRAMGRLRDVADVHLVLVGAGIEAGPLRMLVDELRLRTVHFVDAVPPEMMPAIMASADVQLVSLADDPLFRITMPSKIQSILACGQPMVAAIAGDAARVVRDAGAGFVSRPGDDSELAEVLRQARNTPRQRLLAMGQAGHDYYNQVMSESTNSWALADIVRAAARGGGARCTDA
jgi:glycosyltransferase involved in cell wall biosynthesis